MTSQSQDLGWTFDGFDVGTLELAGKKELDNYTQFLEEYSTQLRCIENALDEYFEEAWDFNLDPVSLQMAPTEQATLLTLVRTDHKIFNKVILVFAALCSEVMEMKHKVVHKFYYPLVMYGEGGKMEDGILQDGEAQLMMGRMIPVLQDLANFIGRIYDLVRHMMQQLAAFYSVENSRSVMQSQGILLQTAFEAVGEGLSILITLDEIFKAGDTFREHWTQYKRVVKSIRGAPAEYGVEDSKLRSLEKILQTLEGKLMEGKILQNCLVQIFDLNQVDVSKNTFLSDVFFASMRNIFVQIDSRIGEPNEMNHRHQLVSLCGLMALHFSIFNIVDKKFSKQVWDIYKKLPAVYLVGGLIWFPNQFLWNTMPYFRQILDKKMIQALDSARDNYFNTLTQNIIKACQALYIEVSSWMIRMESAAKPTRDSSLVRQRAGLFINGLLSAYKIGHYVKTMMNYHSYMRKPMTKSTLLHLCKLLELLKSIQFTFHRCSLNTTSFTYYIIQTYQLDIISIIEGGIARLTAMQQTRYSDKSLDTVAALQLMKTLLNGPGTKERCLVVRLAYYFINQPKVLNGEEMNNINGILKKIEAVSELQLRLREICDCSFLYWHKEVIVPLYLADLYSNPPDAHRLHYIFTCLSDCVPIMKCSKHLESPDVLLSVFEQEIDGYLNTEILDKLCKDIETDLRLHSHLHLQLDDRNPFKVGMRNLNHFLEVKPVRFFDKTIDVKAHVTHYLDTTFYNLTTVSLHDWKTYGDMRNLAEQKYGLVMIEPQLPSQTLEQGLDVLEIMRNIHIFVANYCYNLNNQIFVERSSKAKFLSSINIRHIANSIRTHGTGIMNTTVNFTYQFLRKKFYIFSQFMYDEYIKARVMKEIRFYKEAKFELDQKYPYERADKFNKVIRKLGISPDGLTYLDQFRILITQIGNAMGYIRMIRSGGLHCCSNAIRFVPDLDDIVTFEDMVADDLFSEETKVSAKVFDSVIGNLSKNFSEGNEYFKLLVDVFAPVFRNPKNRHLQNFYMIIPPLTLNFIDYIMNAKDRMTKKNKQGAIFTDDGFAMGVAYILKLLDQYHAFDSLHWFPSVMEKYKSDLNKTHQSLQQGRDDEKLQQTVQLTKQRLAMFAKEFQLLHYSLSSARIFFRADLTAAEEDEQKEPDATEGGNKPAAGAENNEDGGQPPPPPSDPGAGGGAPPPPPPPPPPIPA